MAARPIRSAQRSQLQFSNHVDDCPYGRSISWTRPDVMKSNDSFGIDWNVAAQLVKISTRSPEASPFQEKLRIDPPRTRPVDLPPVTALHAICSVKGASLVNNHRPWKISVADVCLCHGPYFERNYNYLHSQSLKVFFLLTQLRQVLTAGQSSEMSVKHEQQPIAGVLREHVHIPSLILQIKRDGVRAYSIIHRST